MTRTNLRWYVAARTRRSVLRQFVRYFNGGQARSIHRSKPLETMTWTLYANTGRAWVQYAMAGYIGLDVPWCNAGRMPEVSPFWGGPMYAEASRPWRDWREQHAWMRARYGTSCPGCPEHT